MNINDELNKLNTNQRQELEKWFAEQIFKLEISDDNEASIKIATKNGFKNAGERYYSLTLNDFLERNQERVE